MRNFYIITALLVVLTVSVLGFRGTQFTHSPIDVFPEWLFPGMKHQPKYKTQGSSAFFADGRADRPLPAGVVAADFGPLGQPLITDDRVSTGREPDGSFVAALPGETEVNNAFLKQGQQEFTIYCAPCHGALGDGQGITKQYGMGATPTFQDERLLNMPDGEIFNTITHGKNNMLSYADKLTVTDRWAVVAYVRALQRAQHGSAADVPQAHKSELGIQ